MNGSYFQFMFFVFFRTFLGSEESKFSLQSQFGPDVPLGYSTHSRQRQTIFVFFLFSLFFFEKRKMLFITLQSDTFYDCSVSVYCVESFCKVCKKSEKSRTILLSRWANSVWYDFRKGIRKQDSLCASCFQKCSRIRPYSGSSLSTKFVIMLYSVQEIKKSYQNMYTERTDHSGESPSDDKRR